MSHVRYYPGCTVCEDKPACLITLITADVRTSHTACCRHLQAVVEDVFRDGEVALLVQDLLSPGPRS